MIGCVILKVENLQIVLILLWLQICSTAKQKKCAYFVYCWTQACLLYLSRENTLSFKAEWILFFDYISLFTFIISPKVTALSIQWETWLTSRATCPYCSHHWCVMAVILRCPYTVSSSAQQGKCIFFSLLVPSLEVYLLLNTV